MTPNPATIITEGVHFKIIPSPTDHGLRALFCGGPNLDTQIVEKENILRISLLTRSNERPPSPLLQRQFITRKGTGETWLLLKHRARPPSELTGKFDSNSSSFTNHTEYITHITQAINELEIQIKQCVVKETDPKAEDKHLKQPDQNALRKVERQRILLERSKNEWENIKKRLIAHESIQSDRDKLIHFFSLKLYGLLSKEARQQFIDQPQPSPWLTDDAIIKQEEDSIGLEQTLLFLLSLSQTETLLEKDRLLIIKPSEVKDLDDSVQATIITPEGGGTYNQQVINHLEELSDYLENTTRYTTGDHFLTKLPPSRAIEAILNTYCSQVHQEAEKKMKGCHAKAVSCQLTEIANGEILTRSDYLSEDAGYDALSNTDLSPRRNKNSYNYNELNASEAAMSLLFGDTDPGEQNFFFKKLQVFRLDWGNSHEHALTKQKSKSSYWTNGEGERKASEHFAETNEIDEELKQYLGEDSLVAYPSKHDLSMMSHTKKVQFIKDFVQTLRAGAQIVLSNKNNTILDEIKANLATESYKNDVDKLKDITKDRAQKALDFINDSDRVFNAFSNDHFPEQDLITDAKIAYAELALEKIENIINHPHASYATWAYYHQPKFRGIGNGETSGVLFTQTLRQDPLVVGKNLLNSKIQQLEETLRASHNESSAGETLNKLLDELAQLLKPASYASTELIKLKKLLPPPHKAIILPTTLS